MAFSINRAFIATANTSVKELSLNAFTEAAQTTTYQFAVNEIREQSLDLLLNISIDNVQIRVEVDEADFKASENYERQVRLDYKFNTSMHVAKRVEMQYSTKGLKDLRKWSVNIGKEAALVPDRLFWSRLQDSNTKSKLDGLAYFATNHPFNPEVSANGTFSNNLVGAQYDISTAVSLEQAVQNLNNAKVVASSVKRSNGVDLRGTTPKYLFVPQSLSMRADLLTGNGGLGQVSGTDYSRVSRNFGLQVVVVPQLTDPDRYFLGFDTAGDQEEAATAIRWIIEDGQIIFSEVESKTDLELATANELIWLWREMGSMHFIDPSKMFAFNPS